MPAAFRSLTLELPEIVEWQHHGKPDFRVGGRIFAAPFFPNEEWGMVAVRPHEQDMLIATEPVTYRSASDSWGLRGHTNVKLDAAGEVTLRSALRMAWRCKAGTRILKRYPDLAGA